MDINRKLHEWLDQLANVYNQLIQISTKGENTKNMGSALWGLEYVIEEIDKISAVVSETEDIKKEDDTCQ